MSVPQVYLITNAVTNQPLFTLNYHFLMVDFDIYEAFPFAEESHVL